MQQRTRAACGFVAHSKNNAEKREFNCCVFSPEPGAWFKRAEQEEEQVSEMYLVKMTRQDRDCRAEILQLEMPSRVPASDDKHLGKL